MNQKPDNSDFSRVSGTFPASSDNTEVKASISEILAAVRARTPARLLVGRTGQSYRTSTQLDLREDHAVAVDAVQAELDLARDFGSDFVKQFGLFEVSSRARDKADFLKQPELGRRFSDEARIRLISDCRADVELQLVIGDGLSAAAVVAQVPVLLPLLIDGGMNLGWTVGQTFGVRHCRVGILNEIGELLRPSVVVLLIGERPGLATAESLSAYMAHCPRTGHSDAQRNLISNIHVRGVPPAQAAGRILALAEQMRQQKSSGVAIKEQFSTGIATQKSLEA